MLPCDHVNTTDCCCRRLTLACVGVFTLTLVACCIYVPTLHYDMIFDDFSAIVNNESIHKLTPLFGKNGAYGPLNPQPNTPVSARPVVSLTLAINYHFRQVDPMGYRLTHLVLHLIAAFILWAVVAATLRQPVLSICLVKYRQPLAFTAALLWMVHPAHTETVVYLTQRTELLMGVFYVLTLYCAIRFWDSRQWLARGVWCAAALCSSVLGMLSKEMMASVPAMVLVYEWTFIGGSLWVITKRSWMLHIGLAISWLPLVAMYATGHSTPLGGFGTISAYEWWITQANSFFVYWRLLFVPWPLLLHYHFPTLSSFSDAWPGVLGIAAYGLATIYLLWRRKASGFVLLWFFAALSPTLIVPLPHEEISERRLYVPLQAIIPFLSIGSFFLLQKLWQRLTGTASAEQPLEHSPCEWRRFAFGQSISLVFLVACVSISVSTLPRLQYRQSVWLEVLKHQPDNTFAIASQGAVEFNRGEIESGLAKIQYAFDTDPHYSYFRSAIVNALNEARLHERLLATTKRIYELSPEDPFCNCNLAIALEKNGRVDEAIHAYRESIRLDPHHWEAHSGLGTLLAEQNQVSDAIKHFEVATRIKPDFINCMNLMSTYISTGQHKKAYFAAQKLLVAAHKESTPEIIEQIEQELRVMESQLQIGNATQ